MKRLPVLPGNDVIKKARTDPIAPGNPFGGDENPFADNGGEMDNPFADNDDLFGEFADKVGDGDTPFGDSGNPFASEHSGTNTMMKPFGTSTTDNDESANGSNPFKDSFLDDTETKTVLPSGGPDTGPAVVKASVGVGGALSKAGSKATAPVSRIINPINPGTNRTIRLSDAKASNSAAAANRISSNIVNPIKALPAIIKAPDPITQTTPNPLTKTAVNPLNPITKSRLVSNDTKASTSTGGSQLGKAGESTISKSPIGDVVGTAAAATSAGGAATGTTGSTATASAKTGTSGRKAKSNALNYQFKTKEEIIAELKAKKEAEKLRKDKLKQQWGEDWDAPDAEEDGDWEEGDWEEGDWEDGERDENAEEDAEGDVDDEGENAAGENVTKPKSSQPSKKDWKEDGDEWKDEGEEEWKVEEEWEENEGGFNEEAWVEEEEDEWERSKGNVPDPKRARSAGKATSAAGKATNSAVAKANSASGKAAAKTSDTVAGKSISAAQMNAVVAAAKATTARAAAASTLKTLQNGSVVTGPGKGITGNVASSSEGTGAAKTGVIYSSGAKATAGATSSFGSHVQATSLFSAKQTGITVGKLGSGVATGNLSSGAAVGKPGSVTTGTAGGGRAPGSGSGVKTIGEMRAAGIISKAGPKAGAMKGPTAMSSGFGGAMNRNSSAPPSSAPAGRNNINANSSLQGQNSAYQSQTQNSSYQNQNQNSTYQQNQTQHSFNQNSNQNQNTSLKRPREAESEPPPVKKEFITVTPDYTRAPVGSHPLNHVYTNTAELRSHPLAKSNPTLLQVFTQRIRDHDIQKLQRWCEGGGARGKGGPNAKANLIGKVFEGVACIQELLNGSDAVDKFNEEAAVGHMGNHYNSGTLHQLQRGHQFQTSYYYIGRHAHRVIQEEESKKNAEEHKQQMRTYNMMDSAQGGVVIPISGTPTILMIAEKPMIAKALAEKLSPHGRWRQKPGTLSKAIPTYEFHGKWQGQHAKFIVSSTIGHIFGLSFKQQKGLNPFGMFDADTTKEIEEGCRKARLVENLQDLAKSSDYLCLWLDCDREGENIAYECISILREYFPKDDRIYRAHFSALTEESLKYAFENLKRPNKFLSMSVDARQELDLKVGCAFTRMLTWNFLNWAQLKFPFVKELKVLSYGPCQTPTLYFCVQRHREIKNFVEKPYIEMTFLLGGVRFKKKLEELGKGASGHQQVQQIRQELLAYRGGARVLTVHEEKKYIKKPVGLNTVELLKSASHLGISPKATMTYAEELYGQGFISYPRTETTKYPTSFNVREVVQELGGGGAIMIGGGGGGKSFGGKDSGKGAKKGGHGIPGYSTICSNLIQYHSHSWPPRDGVDKGDHPPITPLRSCGRGDLKQNHFKIYELIVKHFLASLHEDVQYTEHTAKAVLDQEIRGMSGGNRYSGGKGGNQNQTEFDAVWHTVVNKDKSFLNLLPHRGKFLKEAGSFENEDQDLNNMNDNYNGGGRGGKGRKESKRGTDANNIPLGGGGGRGGMGGNSNNIPLGRGGFGANDPSRNMKISSNLRIEQRMLKLDVKEGTNEPPQYLTESELVTLMDQHGIGTDASMAGHIENVVTRNYVMVCEKQPDPHSKKPGPRIISTKGGKGGGGKGKGGKGGGKGGGNQTGSRHMVPTGLGLAVLDMFLKILPELCQPDIRAFMEKQCNQIADGNSSKEAVVNENLMLFKNKFRKFEENLESIRHILAPKEGSEGYDPHHQFKTSSLNWRGYNPNADVDNNRSRQGNHNGTTNSVGVGNHNAVRTSNAMSNQQPQRSLSANPRGSNINTVGQPTGGSSMYPQSINTASSMMIQKTSFSNQQANQRASSMDAVRNNMSTTVQRNVGVVPPAPPSNQNSTSTAMQSVQPKAVNPKGFSGERGSFTSGRGSGFSAGNNVNDTKNDAWGRSREVGRDRGNERNDRDRRDRDQRNDRRDDRKEPSRDNDRRGVRERSRAREKDSGRDQPELNRAWGSSTKVGDFKDGWSTNPEAAQAPPPPPPPPAPSSTAANRTASPKGAHPAPPSAQSSAQPGQQPQVYAQYPPQLYAPPAQVAQAYAPGPPVTYDPASYAAAQQAHAAHAAAYAAQQQHFAAAASQQYATQYADPHTQVTAPQQYAAAHPHAAQYGQQPQYAQPQSAYSGYQYPSQQYGQQPGYQYPAH